MVYIILRYKLSNTENLYNSSKIGASRSHRSPKSSKNGGKIGSKSEITIFSIYCAVTEATKWFIILKSRLNKQTINIYLEIGALGFHNVLER